MRKDRDLLRPIQRWMVDTIKSQPATIMAWDMGAGKGVTTLTAILDLLDERVIRRVLVVAPRLVASGTWPDEIEEWAHTRELEYTLLRVEDDDASLKAWKDDCRRFLRQVVGSEPKDATSVAGRLATKKKARMLARLADTNREIHIVNREALPWLWEHFGNGKRWPYDALVVDEASMFKNGKKRTGLKKLSQFGVAAKARKFAKRTVLLTGTPTPKGLQNLWGLAYIADLGERLGTSRSAFESRWFEKDYMGWNLEPRAGAKEEITDRLRDIMFALDPKDYAKLPPLVSNPRYIKLPKRVMAEYHEFRKTLVSEVYDVEAVNGGALIAKLLQFANGSMYREDGRDVPIHDEKLHALEDIIEEANGEPVLVAYSYRFDLQRIRKRFKNAVIFGQGDTRETKRRWNAGEIDLMLAHPASVGHGQNIQFGGRIAVWYGLTHDLELYLQFNKRLHRPGQDRTVFLHHIVAKGTYDEELLPILGTKDATQRDILKNLRKTILV